MTQQPTEQNTEYTSEPSILVKFCRAILTAHIDAAHTHVVSRKNAAYEINDSREFLSIYSEHLHIIADVLGISWKAINQWAAKQELAGWPRTPEIESLCRAEYPEHLEKNQEAQNATC